jgi:hypothetical protein
VQRDRFGSVAGWILVSERGGEYELGIFPGFEWNFVYVACQKQQEVFGEEELDELVHLFRTGIGFSKMSAEASGTRST